MKDSGADVSLTVKKKKKESWSSGLMWDQSTGCKQKTNPPKGGAI